jgi:L-asparaginase II
MTSPIRVSVRRGDAVESRHAVHAVAVRDGALVESAGDPDLVTVMRSAAKPLQALPVALVAPDLPNEELAIACASHEALPDQLAAVKSLLARSWSTEDDLECGAESGSRLRHNCSGKHAGMLLVTKRREWPLPGYRFPDHPLQRELLEVVSEAAGMSASDVELGIDGCGVLAFGLPLRAMATAFARLGTHELNGSQRVTAAMVTHPELIGGPDAVDTAVMQAVPGVLAKRGAEGVLCAALADGTGVALKVEDGAARAIPAAAAAFLGAEALRSTTVFNSRHEPVGSIEADS